MMDREDLMKILYFDCFSGISGDMVIGALLDAGGNFSYLKKELKKLPIEDEYEISICQVNKNGITGTKFEVTQLNNMFISTMLIITIVLINILLI